MEKLIKNGVFFTLGGSGYVGLELLYRGRSHISMFAAGGTCFLLLGKLERRLHSGPGKAVLGALTVTGVELVTGLLVNRDHSVWDYRGLPWHFRGQICPYFTLLWLPLSAGAMVFYRQLDRLWERRLPTGRE